MSTMYDERNSRCFLVLLSHILYSHKICHKMDSVTSEHKNGIIFESINNACLSSLYKFISDDRVLPKCIKSFQYFECFFFGYWSASGRRQPGPHYIGRWGMGICLGGMRNDSERGQKE